MDNLYHLLTKHFEKFVAKHNQEATNLYKVCLKEMEIVLIEQTMIHTKGNQIHASKMLGLNRNTLRKKIVDYNIKIEDFKKLT